MKKVLFIGNSHTYFNDMPFLFQSFTESEQAKRNGVEPMEAVMIVHGGRKLCEHLREPEVHYNIKFGGYDYVVLQQAAHPFPGKEELLSDGKALCDLIHAAGSRPVGYMTWAEKAYPEHQQIMIESYTELCAQNKGILAPVGAVWETIRKDPANPVELYYTDGEHASICGSYLAAVVIYAAVTGTSPVGLPYRLEHHGELLYEITQEQAAYLQKKAEDYLWG